MEFSEAEISSMGTGGISSPELGLTQGLVRFVSLFLCLSSVIGGFFNSGTVEFLSSEIGVFL